MINAHVERWIGEHTDSPLTVRCMCGWAATGQPNTVLEAGRAHRLTHHPERISKRRSTPTSGRFPATSNLDENIQRVRGQGGHTTWEGTHAD